MDYKQRQGRKKLKLSIQEVRKLGIYVEIEQPEVVYHMTDKDNMADILNDGKIKSFNDYMTYFFSETKFIPLYIQLSNALQGRMYYGTDRTLKKAPPLDIEHTVVLKLIPSRKEKMEWYREVIKPKKWENEEISKIMNERQKSFDECRICHYGDFSFKKDVEIMNLSDIYENIPQDIQSLIEWHENLVAAYENGKKK